MRILICDDNSLMIDQIEKYLHIYFDKIKTKYPEIVRFSNGESLLADNGAKDIVFLDIEMPGMNGIFVGNELKKQNENVIIFIVTSYSEYLDEAMRFHVFRYLSKPLEKQRFFRNFQDALELYHTLSIKIPIETKHGVHIVSTTSIIAIEAIGRKIIVHTTTQDFESIHNMHYWHEVLPQNCFFQTHRSFIINFEHVTDFDHSLVHMDNNKFNAYLTKRKYSEFKNAYLLYLESMR